MIQNRTNIKKEGFKNRIFVDRLLDPKMEQKRVPKPAEMEAKMVQNRLQKRAQRKKRGKYENEQYSYVLARF